MVAPDPAGKPSVPEPTFEQALEQVEAIVRRIESGEVGLESSITEYERGVELLNRCRAVLGRVEQRVTDLTTQMNAGGGVAGGAGSGGGGGSKA